MFPCLLLRSFIHLNICLGFFPCTVLETRDGNPNKDKILIQEGSGSGSFLLDLYSTLPGSPLKCLSLFTLNYSCQLKCHLFSWAFGQNLQNGYGGSIWPADMFFLCYLTYNVKTKQLEITYPIWNLEDFTKILGFWLKISEDLQCWVQFPMSGADWCLWFHQSLCFPGYLIPTSWLCPPMIPFCLWKSRD